VTKTQIGGRQALKGLGNCSGGFPFISLSVLLSCDEYTDGRQALKSVGNCSDSVRFISTSSALFLSYADEITDGRHAGTQAGAH
jgi:hypothetical protein